MQKNAKCLISGLMYLEFFKNKTLIFDFAQISNYAYLGQVRDVGMEYLTPAFL
jgi:hypothetical protein